MFLSRTLTRFPEHQWFLEVAARFRVLDKDGNSFTTSRVVLDKDGNPFTVLPTVLDKDGNAFVVI